MIDRPHRTAYLDYETLTATLEGWAAAHPTVVRLHSLGTSEEGRELWVLTLGEDPDRDRPSVWVDGNMHASELAGSNVALDIAAQKILLHTGERTAFGLPEHVCDALREVRFFVMPRMCPDGAEATLKDGRYVRSNPRDRRPASPTPRWRASDVDGDGHARIMRQVSDDGEFVESATCPGLLLPRELEDRGPFYKVYPEGTIENFDGTIPDPHYLQDNDTDLNRNFPYTWRPEPDQAGAGRYPLSEPESRAVVEFTTQNPTIFAWLNLHTFGGVYIRPLGTAPDHKMNAEDLAVFRQVGAWVETFGGYPMVNGFDDFLYEPEKPLYGDLSDFAYHQRGAIAYVCELWDLFRVIGMEKKKPFVDHYSHLTRADLERLYAWDKAENHGRVFPPWRSFAHPQLGQVEVGGLDIRFGITNPPMERLAEMCDAQAAAFLRVAAMAPQVRLIHTGTTRLGEVSRVSFRVENVGYLPTHVLDSARRLEHGGPLTATAETHGCELLDDAAGRRDVGHLLGYGRGLHAHSIFHLRSRGSVSRKDLTFTVRGSGMLTVRVLGHRVGALTARIEIA